jgi:hypothetical protein
MIMPLSRPDLCVTAIAVSALGGLAVDGHARRRVPALPTIAVLFTTVRANGDIMACARWHGRSRADRVFDLSVVHSKRGIQWDHINHASSSTQCRIQWRNHLFENVKL